MEVVIEGDWYRISYKNYCANKVAFCRDLQGSRYRGTHRAWFVPRILPNALDLHRAGYFTDRDVLSIDAQGGVKGQYIWDTKWKKSIDLFKHQRDWSEWCTHRPKSILVAEMGLGKTLMTMLWWKAWGIHPHDILVICPKSLIHTWEEEIYNWTGETAIPVIGSAKQKNLLCEQRGLHVINYDSVVDGEMVRSEFNSKRCIVLDECHKIKNPSAKRSKALAKFSLQIDYAILLTGTLISQGAQDYYSPFKVINPKLLGNSYSGFKGRYCIEEQIRGAPPGVRRITGYKKLDELTNILNPYMFTRLKKDCLDLPDKQYTVRYVDITPEQRKAYNLILREMALELKNGLEITAPNILTRLIRTSQITQGFITQEGEVLQEFTPNPKIEALMDFVEELGSEPLVIICRFKYDIGLIKKTLEGGNYTYAIIDGDVPGGERHTIVRDFQAGKFQFLIGQIQTIGVGFTLTRASKMLFYSNNYSLVDRKQAEDRIHRIGQHSTCLYIDLIARDTVDEAVLIALRNKEDVATMLTKMNLEQYAVDNNNISSV